MKRAAHSKFKNPIDSLTLENRKDLGIFYTDINLAEAMLKEISPSSNSVILDPCCGIGIFLDAAKFLGYNNVYGCDIDPEGIETCKEKGHNVIEWDSIFRNNKYLLEELNLQKGVDLIIGNPPYAMVGPHNCSNLDSELCRSVKKHGNNLFIGSIIQSINLLKHNGMLSYIIPKNFLHVSAYSALRKEILNNYKIVEIIDIGAHFSGVRGEQIIITIKKCKSSNNTIFFKKYENNKFNLLCRIPQNFYSDEIMIFNSNQDFSVYKKLYSNKLTLFEFRDINIHRGHSKSSNAVRGRDIRKYGFKDKKVIKDGNQLFIQNIYSAESGSIAAYGGNLEASETVTVISSNNNANCKLILALLHSSIWNMFLYKYCYNSSKLTMHTDAKYLYKIPIPSEDTLDKYKNQVLKYVESLEIEEYLSNKWFKAYHKLDELIHMIYGMNKYEKLYINSEVNKVQSERWKQCLT